MVRNIYGRKVNSKFSKLSFFKKNLILLFCCFALISMATIGYSALNQTLNITGDLALRATKDIRISDLKVVNTTNGGYELYNSKYTADTIILTADLSEPNSSVTYSATITNYGSMDMEIASISVSSLMPDFYQIQNLEEEDVIPAGESKVFSIIMNSCAYTNSEELGIVIELTYQESQPRYLAYTIYGNSVQNGTPTPDKPVNVESVGENSKNLFDANKYANDMPTTYKIIDDDLYLIVDHTPSWNLYPISANLNAGTYTISVSNPSTIQVFDLDKQVQLARASTNVSNLSFTVNQNTNIGLKFKNSDQTSNFLIGKVQIEQGKTSTEYRPYRYVDINVSGKNLLEYTYLFTTKTSNGVTATVNSDGSVTLNGTATGDTFFKLKGSEFHLPSGTYIMNGYMNSHVMVFASPNGGKNYYNQPFTITDTDGVFVYITSKNGETYNNETFYLQIEQGETSTTYEQYQEPVTTRISLTGHEPLRKIGNVSDYIDYENQKIVRNIGKFILYGTETYKNMTSEVSLTNTSWFQTTLPTNFVNTNGKSTHFDLIDGSTSDTEHLRYITNTNMLGIFINKSVLETDDITGFTSWLATQNANGTPVIIYYQLDTAIEEPIVLPDIIKRKEYTNVNVLSNIAPSNIEYSYITK